MLVPSLFTHILGRYGSKDRNNSRYYMSDFPLFVAVPSKDYYLSMKGKQKTFYVRSYYLFKSLTITDTIEQDVEVIANILCQIFTGVALIIGSRSKKGYFRHYMLVPFIFTHMFGRYGSKEENSRHSMLAFPLFMEFSSSEYYL